MTDTNVSSTRPTESELTLLYALAKQFPNVDSAMAEIARLSAVLTLPKGTIHVISDVHGEDKKLRHVINNASGTLRPLVEKLFASRMDAKQLQDFLTLIFYPAEVVEHLEQKLSDTEKLRAFASATLKPLFELVRTLAARYSLRRAMSVFPLEYRDLLTELLYEDSTDRGPQFLQAIIDELSRRGRVLHLIHLMGRLVRNLAVRELIIAGDCWDRGPRGDRVVDYLRMQPNVAFVWGNHDAAWMGACMGHEALIAHVLRVSLRYRRITQLDEGYSVPTTPLEHMARTVYDNDPAENFMPSLHGLRPDVIVARMQKAAAVMQFKLEGQMIARNPQWGMDHRRLLHTIDLNAGTIEVDGKRYPLLDKHLPTFDPAHPYDLSPDERACMDRLRNSFLHSQKLWEHIRYVVSHGSMYLKRDDHLIFHGCLPCDEKGHFLPMPVDGKQVAGREMLELIEKVILRAVEHRELKDLDLLWYLWSGPRSPLFGKDRITTLERDFIEDKQTHEEKKDPYFSLIHESWFCDRVMEEFGVDPSRGLIVNGHVPVKIEKGESPLKRSGKAITIDGAFSEAYGDHGYTLVLEADRTLLAKHHHFESVESAIQNGVDIVPSVSLIRQWNPARTIGDTERGRELRCLIVMLEKLIDAYRNNDIHQVEHREANPVWGDL